MGIGSYKEAERYRMRTNKNLTRSFYLDTRRTLDEEPFAWEQTQDAGIMQPGTVQEFSDGGRVGFELGGKVRSRGEKIMSKDKLDLINNIVSESNLNPFSSLSKNKVLEKAGYSHSAYSFVNSQVKEKLKTLIPIEEKFKNYVYSMMDNSNNILFDDLVKDNGIKNHLEKKFNLTVTNPTSPKIKNVYNIPEIKEFIKQGSHYETLNSYKNKQMTLSEVFNNIGSKKSYGIPNVSGLPGNIIAVAARSERAGNKNIKFINKDNKDVSNIMFEFNNKIYGVNPDVDVYNGKKVINLTTTDLRTLPEFSDYIKSLEKLEIKKNEIVEHPKSKKLVTLDNLLQETYNVGRNYMYGRSALELDHLDIKNKPFSDLRILPKHINQAAGLINKSTSTIKNKELALKGIGYNIPEEAITDSILKYADRTLVKKIPITKTTVDVAKEKISKIENLLDTTTEEKKAINLLNRVNFGADPNLIKELYGKEINTVKNLLNKVPGPIKAAGKIFGIGDVILETILAAPDVLQGDIEAAKRGSIFGLFGYGKELDEEILEQAKNKESVQRAIQNLKLTPELRNLMEEKKSIEQGLAKGTMDEEQKLILSQNLNTIDNRIKEINDYLSKNEYLEEDETNFLNTAFDLAKSKAKKAEKMFGPQFKQAQGPTLEQRLFKKILDEEGYSELIPEESKQKIAGTYTPIEIPEIQAPDDSMMRQEFKKGGISRRDILALLTGAAAAPELIKAIKGTKKAAQTVRTASKIKIEPAEGMYEWFPKLVEKVKEMGKPIKEEQLIMVPSYKNSPRPFTSRLPTGEEKLTKHVDGDTTFILREYPDGRIAVDIDSPRNQQLYGQPLSLYYRPKMQFKNYKGEIKVEPAEFKVLEAEPRLFANGPDDVDIDYTEVVKNPKRNTVFGDVEAAERFATGKIKNRKIIPVKQSLRNEMEDDPSTFIMRQSGELGSASAPEEVIKSSEDILKLPE